MGVVSLSPTATAACIQLFQSQQQSPPPPLLRGVFQATRGSEGGGGGGEAFSISTRTQICFPPQRRRRRRRLLFFRAKSVESSSIVDGLQNFRGNFREDHRDSLDDVAENSPNLAEEELQQHISKASATKLPIHSRNLKAMAMMTDIGTEGQLHPNTLYLVDIGLDINQIKKMARKCHSITCPSWGRKVRSLVEFFLELGVPPSDIPNILYKAPTLCNLSLSKNIIPSMAYLETLGLDKSKWAKVIHRSPHLLTYSQQKVEATVDYLYELGLSSDRIGKVLTNSPKIVHCSIDDNLRPTADYFRSMGVNLTSLLSGYPMVFLLSIEGKLKPVTEFFLDKGYNVDEIGSMASRFGAIYGLSLTKNLIPKWDFFLTMDYPRSELVKCPTYFGCSLEKRIKPRYALMREFDVKLPMGTLLSTSDSDYLVILNRRKAKKMLEAQLDPMAVTSDDLESDM